MDRTTGRSPPHSPARKTAPRTDPLMSGLTSTKPAITLSPDRSSSIEGPGRITAWPLRNASQSGPVACAHWAGSSSAATPTAATDRGIPVSATVGESDSPGRQSRLRSATLNPAPSAPGIDSTVKFSSRLSNSFPNSRMGTAGFLSSAHSPGTRHRLRSGPSINLQRAERDHRWQSGSRRRDNGRPSGECRKSGR